MRVFYIILRLASCENIHGDAWGSWGWCKDVGLGLIGLAGRTQPPFLKAVKYKNETVKYHQVLSNMTQTAWPE